LRDSVLSTLGGLDALVRDERWKLIVYPSIITVSCSTCRTTRTRRATSPATPPTLAGRAPHRPDEVVAGEVGDSSRSAWQRRGRKDVRFDDSRPKPDPWQPDWIVKKYFRQR